MKAKGLCFIILFLLTCFTVSARDFYWESPVPVQNSDSRFPVSDTNGKISVVLWQEIVSTAADSGSIYLTAMVHSGDEWLVRQRFAGPFAYTGEVPSLASVTVDRKNRIIVSTLSGIDQVAVYISTDLGSSFRTVYLNSAGEAVLAPHVYERADGGYLLFATSGNEESFSMVYSRSADAIEWSPLQVFAPSTTLRQAFLPTHVVSGSRDLVVFQALNDATARPTFQLYATYSTDGALSWSAASLVTDFRDSEAGTLGFDSFNNQRPRMINVGGRVSLFWERGRSGLQKYRIYHAPLGANGLMTEPGEPVSSADGFCYDPTPFEMDGQSAVVWFDNRRGGNRIFLGVRDGFFWTEYDLSRTQQESVFGRPVLSGNTLEVFWQQVQSRGGSRIVRLSPDRTVLPPVITGVGYTVGSRSRSDRVNFSVRLPEDSSGIAGYSTVWARSRNAPVPAEIQSLPGPNRFQGEADADGSWYLGVRVADYAGNWSIPAWAEFIRDTTAPVSPVVLDPPVDGRGFLSSNSFTLNWEPPADEDVAGYTWSLEYLSSPAQIAARSSSLSVSAPRLAAALGAGISVGRPPAALRTVETSVSFSNRDNGLYAFSVAAIDTVGNIGTPTVYYLALDKYVPYTAVTYAESKLDDTGTLSLSIIGRGFTDEGTASAVYLDRDGQAPWDITLTRSQGQFTVNGDRLISGIKVADIEEGEYRIGIQHPKRGLYQTRPLLTITATGTVKYGDFEYEFIPAWQRTDASERSGPGIGLITLSAVMLFALAVLVFSIHGIAGTAREALSIRWEVQALITGDVMPSEKKKRGRALRNRGLGLRFKLAFFTTTLVVAVTLLVSIPLGLQFSRNQERTLSSGLQSRVYVLLESLASGARVYLPSQNTLELGFLPEQIAALDEASWATVTGQSANANSTHIDFVWASNDPDLEQKIDSAELAYGGSRLSDPASEEIAKVSEALNTEAENALGELSESISELTREGIQLALRTDADSRRRVEEIQTISRQLEERLNRELAALSVKGMGSWPLFDPESISRTETDYVFYKPVLYRQGTQQQYVRGSVRIQISTESLLKTLDRDRRNLVQTTMYTAMFAILIGVLGALALASIIISPVRKLAAHVAMIRDTEDKESLDGQDIKLRSRDEIGLLGETINDMTHGLIKAAAASKDLTVGKEVQKMFIPLETDSSGRKLTSGSSVEDNAEFFGYYEGAKGVSGDYFDYIKLDQRHYAIIKCDVAGKGVPAALIMVEVATLFLDYFKDWTYQKNGFRIDYIVSRINDLIESRGFKGRFAAFTLCILDSVSGDVHFCNAGDNMVHIYDAVSRKMKVLTLPETPAAGVFPSFMVEMKGGFKVVKAHLNPGDVLYFYTDGIEEAKRQFRTADLKVMECAHPGLAREAPHETHSVGKMDEELGPERVYAIIEAVFARKTYKLVKWHNPIENEDFDFDFTGCQGTMEESILALVSVEKIFRMYRDSAAGDFDRVQVDRKVDTFLSAHFRQYEAYCSRHKDHPSYPEYMYYTGIREDAQYDDLTILGIRKR